MAKKITKREYFNKLLAITEVSEDNELVEFINHELELLARKNSSGGGSYESARQVENRSVLKPQVLEFLESSGGGVTATEIANGVELDVSVPRVSAMLKKLFADGVVTREVGKGGKPYFSLA